MLKRLIISTLLLIGISSAQSQVKFVCIGNSISHGKYTSGIFHGTTIGDSLTEMSYRFWFWEKVDSAGVNATMVGANTTYFDQGANPVTSVSRYTGHTFVNNSEAYYGIKTDGFLAGGWGGNPDFDTRLAGYTPDVALMHIGTNDSDVGVSQINATEANLKSMIQKMRGKNPNVTILLAKLSSFWSGINGRVDSLCKVLSTPNSIVYPVDIAFAFLQDDLGQQKFLLDGIHPNVNGQKAMANLWYKAYMQITKPDLIKPSTPSGLYASAMTASTIDLRWTASTDNTGVNVYKIYVNDSLVSVTGNLTCKITGLNTAATTYNFRVSAVDYQKNESDKSNGIKSPVSVTFHVNDGTIPVSGATITFNSVNKTTDASGIAVFSGQRPGALTYMIKANNFKNRAGNVMINSDTSFTISMFKTALPLKDMLVNVYPNPASDNIIITQAAGSNVAIVNETGICLMNLEIRTNEESIDISAIPCGYYMFIITDEENIIAKKIKVQR